MASPAHAFLSTGDGSWVWQNPLPQGNSLNGASFVDARHGWAVGSGRDYATYTYTGVVLATTQ